MCVVGVCIRVCRSSVLQCVCVVGACVYVFVLWFVCVLLHMYRVCGRVCDCVCVLGVVCLVCVLYM